MRPEGEYGQAYVRVEFVRTSVLGDFRSRRPLPQLEEIGPRSHEATAQRYPERATRSEPITLHPLRSVDDPSETRGLELSTAIVDFFRT